MAMFDLDQNSSQMPLNPWETPEEPSADPLEAQAHIGAKRAIANGEVHPKVANDRLVAHGFKPLATDPTTAGNPAATGESPWGLTDQIPTHTPAKGVFNLNKYSQENDTGSKAQTVAVTPLSERPEQSKLKKLVAQGYDVPILGYQKNPNTGVEDRNLPIYDFEHAAPNPNDPVQKQEAGLDRLQDLLRMQNDVGNNAPLSSHTNFSGAALIADLAGRPGQPSNLAAYQNSGQIPETPEQMREKFFAKQQQIQKDRNDIQKSIQAAVNGQKSGTLTDLLALTQGNKKIAENKDVISKGNPELQTNKAFLATVDRDPVLKKAGEMTQGIQHARDMLMGNSPVDASNFRFAMLKALNAGRITEYELKGEQGSKAFWDQLEQKFQTLGSGTLTPQNRQDYLHELDSIANRNAEQLQAVKEFHTNRGVKFFGMDPELASQAVNSYFTQGPSVRPPAKAVARGGNSPAPQVPSQQTVAIGTVKTHPNGHKYKKNAQGSWDLVE